MPLRFYFDTHIAKVTAQQLRVHNLDILRCEDVNLSDAPDETHLEYATSENRIMVSQDTDFAMLHNRWQQDERFHAGIMLVPSDIQGKAQISYIVRGILFYYAAEQVGALSVAEEVHNRLIYL